MLELDLSYKDLAHRLDVDKAAGAERLIKNVIYGKITSRRIVRFLENQLNLALIGVRYDLVENKIIRVDGS
jgi:hypothetical protein